MSVEQIDTANETTDVTDSVQTDAASETSAPSMADQISKELGYEEKESLDTEKPATEDVEIAAKKDADKPEKKDEAKPPAAKPQQAKKTDEELKAPPGLSPEANKRFQGLVSKIKEKDAALAEISAKAQELEQKQAQFTEAAEVVNGYRQIFDDAKCKPEQFETAIGLIKLINNGDYDTAARMLGEQIRMMSLASGKEFNITDPLAQFPDLSQAVQNSQITRQHAMEIAKGRVMEHNAGRQAQAANQQQAQLRAQQEEAQRFQQDVQNGAAQVQQWTEQVSQSDIDWPAKERLLDAKVDWLSKNVHPTQWLAHLQNYYEMLSVGGQQNAAAGKMPQPLRANGGAGGAKPAPSSMLDALNQGLGYHSA